MRSLVLTVALMLPVIQAASADQRFAVVERGDTIIRVDTETGRVSFCRSESAKPVCKIAADERKAWMAEVESLESRVNELEQRIARKDIVPPKPGGKPSGKDDKDLDKALDTAETMMRRFFGILKDLKRDMGSKLKRGQVRRLIGSLAGMACILVHK